jgi:fructokinase
VTSQAVARHCDILAVGEVLWDIFPEQNVLGGAPANLAFHCKKFGSEPWVLSRVGQDQLGDDIFREFSQRGLNTCLVQRDNLRSTGTVQVTTSSAGENAFNICEDVAWDYIDPSERASHLARNTALFYFGCTAQRAPTSRMTIRTLGAAVGKGRWVVFDPNVRDTDGLGEILSESLRLANALKINADELTIISQQFGLTGSHEALTRKLVERFDLEALALTLGESGSLLYRDGRWHEQGGESLLVRDTVGAGDAFCAAWCIGLIAGAPLEVIGESAAHLASRVCEHVGATPDLPADAYRLPCPVSM